MNTSQGQSSGATTDIADVFFSISLAAEGRPQVSSRSGTGYARGGKAAPPAMIDPDCTGAG